MIERPYIIIRKQIRKNAKKKNIESFRAGIKEMHDAGAGLEGTGLTHPLIVSPAIEEEHWDEGELERLGITAADLENYVVLKAGERRYWATETFLDELPCVSMSNTKLSTKVIQVAENAQREDNDPLEEAEAFDDLRREGISIRKTAAIIGKDKGYVENRLRLLGMDEDVQEMVSVRKDTLMHGYHINSEKSDPEFRAKLIRSALDGAPARAIEQAVKTGVYNHDAQTFGRKGVNVRNVLASRDTGITVSRGKAKKAAASTPAEETLTPLQRTEKIKDYLFAAKLQLDRAVALITQQGGPVKDHLREIDGEIKGVEERSGAIRASIPELQNLQAPQEAPRKAATRRR
jgi:ParB/RepB/Spo0J family partition protein